MDDVIFAGTADRPALGPGRGVAHDRQHRRAAADRVLRGHDHPHALPHGRVGVHDQRRAVPAARHPGAALRHRHRPPAARDRRPGSARRGAQRAPRGPPGDHRRSRGHPQVPQAQGEGASAGSRRPRATCCGSPTCCARCAASCGRSSARPTRRAATTGSSPSSTRSRLHLAGREIEQLRDARADAASTRGASSPSEEQDVRVRLRALDAEVLDAEHALAVPGDDDVADVLARTEALRERSRGLVNLVAERRRGPRPRAGRGRRRRCRRDARRRSARTSASSSPRSTPTSTTLAPQRDAEVDEAEAAELRARSARRSRPSVAEAELRRGAEAELADARRAVEQRRRRATRSSVSSRRRAPSSRRSTPSSRRSGRERPRPTTASATPTSVRAEVEAHSASRPSSPTEARASCGPPRTRCDEADASARRADSRGVALARRAPRRSRSRSTRRTPRSAATRSPASTACSARSSTTSRSTTGAEVAVAAALGDALNAVVVDGDDAARAAVERLEARRPSGVAARRRRPRGGTQISLARRRARVRSRRACVGTRPALDPVLARLFAPFVLVDGGWAHALDVALATPAWSRSRAKATASAGRARGAPGPPGIVGRHPRRARRRRRRRPTRRSSARDAADARRRARPPATRRPRAGPSCVATERRTPPPRRARGADRGTRRELRRDGRRAGRLARGTSCDARGRAER